MAKLIFLVMLLCTLLIPQLSYGAGKEEMLHANLDVQKIQNRRVLSVMETKKKVVLKKEVEKNEEAGLGVELRVAPMGPDPLHHTGAPPKKPRTSP